MTYGPERYGNALRAGAIAYGDVIAALDESGLPTSFTQTGGMNAALVSTLEGGFALLITDADDSLAWDRARKNGWGVALFRPDDQFDGPALSAGSTQSPQTQDLLEVVQQVLRAAADPPEPPPVRPASLTGHADVPSALT